MFKEKRNAEEEEAPNYNEMMSYKYKKEIIVLVEQLLREGKNVIDIPCEVVHPFHQFLCEAIYLIDHKKRETEPEKECNKTLERIPENDILKTYTDLTCIDPNDYRYITIRDKFYTIDRFLSKINIET
jgi:hypothetical protein